MTCLRLLHMASPRELRQAAWRTKSRESGPNLPPCERSSGVQRATKDKSGIAERVETADIRPVSAATEPPWYAATGPEGRGHSVHRGVVPPKDKLSPIYSP